MNPCWANSHVRVCVCAPFKCSHQEPLARTMGRDKSLYLSNNLSLNYLFIYIFVCVCVKFSLRHTIWFFHFFESHAEHFVQSEWRLEFASIAATERPSWNDKIWCVQENDAVLIVGWCYPLSQNLLQTKVLSVMIFGVLTVSRPNFGKFLRF